MENQAIDKMKMAIGAAIKLGSSISAAAADGKVTLVESIGIGAKNFGSIMGIIKNASEIREEYRGITEKGARELSDFVRKEFDIENDQVEEIIEQSFDALASLAAISALKPKVKKGKAKKEGKADKEEEDPNIDV